MTEKTLRVQSWCLSLHIISNIWSGLSIVHFMIEKKYFSKKKDLLSSIFPSPFWKGCQTWCLIGKEITITGLD